MMQQVCSVLCDICWEPTGDVRELVSIVPARFDGSYYIYATIIMCSEWILRLVKKTYISLILLNICRRRFNDFPGTFCAVCYVVLATLKNASFSSSRVSTLSQSDFSFSAFVYSFTYYSVSFQSRDRLESEKFPDGHHFSGLIKRAASYIIIHCMCSNSIVDCSLLIREIVLVL